MTQEVQKTVSSSNVCLKDKAKMGEKKIWDGVGFVKFVLSRFAVMGLTCPAAIVTLFLLELSSLYQGKLEAFILNAAMMITFVAFGSLNLSQRRLLKQANSKNFFTLMTSQADWALLTSKMYYFICPQFSKAYSVHFSFKLLSSCKTYDFTYCFESM